MKKIIIATGIFPPEIGGPAFYSEQLAREFSKTGHRAVVITYGKNFKKAPDYEIIGVSRCWPYGLRQVIYFFKLLFKSFGSDGILAFDSLGAGLPAMLAGKILGKKSVIRMGGDFLWEKFVDSGLGMVTMNEFYEKKIDKRSPFLKSLVAFTLRNSDIVAFTTKFQKDIFIRQYGLRSDKALIVDNIFEKGGSESFPYQDGPRIILWTGRFIKVKNLDFLIRVFGRLLKRHPDLILNLIGNGPEEDHIKSMIKERNLSDNVKISGNIGNEFLFDQIKKSYFCVLPSLSDVSPNFALRCLSFNKPIVLTQETGIRDQFPGLLYADPKNEESFFAAALELLDGDKYAKYQKLISDIRYKKTWRDLAEEYLKLLK